LVNAATSCPEMAGVPSDFVPLLLTYEHIMFDHDAANGAEFIRMVKRIGNSIGVDVRFVARHGKRQPRTDALWGALYNRQRAKAVSIGPGLYRKMLRDLGIEE
jgi:hypothetical protein